MSLFASCNFHLCGEFTAASKEDLRIMIERNGGKVNVGITNKVCCIVFCSEYCICACLRNNNTCTFFMKTAFIICSTLTKDVMEKAKTHNLTLLNENYIMDCISARKRLPIASYLPQDAAGEKKKRDPLNNKEDYNIYNFSESPLDDKENHISKIREKLKQFSLKNNKRNKEDNTEDKDGGGVDPSSKKIKLLAKRDEMEDEAIPPLKDLVFFIYGKFSIPGNVLQNIILDRGGSISRVVDDKVTHFLFGGESVDVPEFLEAQNRKIHIVNEYFLRLLVKY
jgi:NAD-dependent DNA ligase